MRVLVIGGGLGGLCLAQGLHRHGIDVTVFERDESPSQRRQGYRLHLDRRGVSALRECLSPDGFARFESVTGTPSRRVTVLSSQLRVLHTMAITDPDSTSVDRGELRSVLLSPAVRHGARFSHYTVLEDGRVRAYLTDGSAHDGDVLVGADGIGSAVRAQHLPAARIIDVGTRCVYGRTLNVTGGT